MRKLLMPYSEGHFDFQSLSYTILRRFIELLTDLTFQAFWRVNKDYYAKCVLIRRIQVTFCRSRHYKDLKVDLLGREAYKLRVQFKSSRHFTRFKTKYSKFFPYFDVQSMSVSCHNLYRVDPGKKVNPVTKNYPVLIGKDVKERSHVDHLIKYYAHSGLEELDMFFPEIDPDVCLILCNHAMKQLPEVKKFHFVLDQNGKMPVKDLSSKLKMPKPSTQVRYRYFLDRVDRIYKDGSWNRFRRERYAGELDNNSNTDSEDDHCNEGDEEVPESFIYDE